MKLAIRTNDNDLNKPWLLLMKSLVEHLDGQTLSLLDKDNLLALVNEIGFSFYLLSRRKVFSANDLKDARLKKYMQIEDASFILVDKEVDDFIASRPYGDNQETIVYDSSIYEKEAQIYLF